MPQTNNATRTPQGLGLTSPKRLLTCLACILLLIAVLNAQEVNSSQKILKNADIVLMTQDHFDDGTLIKVIEVSDTGFDVSSDALVDLMRLGVSPSVLRAMLRSAHKKQAAGSAPASPVVATAPAAESSAPAVLADTPEPPPPAAKSGPGFSTRTVATTSTVTNPAPSAVSVPATVVSAPSGMYVPNGMMGVNPQFLAIQAQLASMGMGGMMGNMGMGMGMGGMGNMGAMNYSPEQLPHVFLKLGPNRGTQEIAPSMAQIGQAKYKGGMGAGGMVLRSLATEGLSLASMGAGPAGMMAMSAFSMASGFLPGMRPGVPTMTYVWGLPGRNSQRELSMTNPMFELTYGDIPGIDPDAYQPAVLKLVQSKDNYRLVGATQMKMTAKNMRNGSGPENGKWISEERWPTHVYKEERGFYILRVDSALEPGEYAVVLRPVKGYKSSPSGLGGHAQVFYSVWDFRVPGEVPEDGMKKTR